MVLFLDHIIVLFLMFYYKMYNINTVSTVDGNTNCCLFDYVNISQF